MEKARGRGAEGASILVFALSVFVLISLATYHPGDPSLFAHSRAAALNACGRVGAYLASAVLMTFGLGGFLIPAALYFLAATLHKREGWIRLIGILGGMTLAVMSMTVFVTLQWKYWPFGGSLMLTGGTFGIWVTDLMVRQFNPLGSALVSLFVFCVAIAASTPISVARVSAGTTRITANFLWNHLVVLFWKGLKLVLVYLFYLLGLLAVRMSSSLNQALQRALRGAADSIEKARAPAAPMIGLEPDPAPVPVPEPEPLPALESKLYSEAPNILEEKAAPAPALAKAPVILPAERKEELASASVADGESAITRASAKLARAASRFRKGNWKLPPVDFLRKPPKVESAIDRERLIQNSQILTQKFADFGIEGEVTAVRPGPVITLYEFKPGPGVKVSRIAALADDLSMALSAQSVRILAPLPGKAVVGIEIPSETRETVYLREFIQHPDFHSTKHAIPVVMGKDIGGQSYLSDLARMPHLLCAGQTGAGKSVFMNGLICSLFYRFTPDELRMILVDPKFIEFRAYQDVPHLLLPVVDDPKQAAIALRWAVREMERRYRILAKVGARNLTSFNQKVEEMGADVIHDLLLSEENQNESSTHTTGSDWIEAFEPDESGAPKVGKLPNVVIIVDELADLMMISKKEVEISIARIAQKARAAGIHLVVATQRPSTDVVTGLIKANLPSRVSFQLASYVDSKTILDRAGAERLLGQGDMLFIPPGMSQLLRLHGAFVDDDEIGKITAFLRSQGKPSYRDEILIDTEEDEDGAEGDEADDDLMSEAIELVKRSGHASASFLQRHLKIGYNRAARMIETMESRGIVGPADGARPREVLMR
jgi:S-DNA-T family DNA segregation ATPase FtsK/SpoIIIE